jgi:hypothetical protein
MRFALAQIVLAGTLLCSGCFTTAPPITTPPAPKIDESVKPPPPVTPESVNDLNYRAQAQALWDELDREDQRNLISDAAKSNLVSDASKKRRE